MKASPKVAQLARKVPGKLITGTRNQPHYRSRVIMNSRNLTRGIEAVSRLIKR